MKNAYPVLFTQSKDVVLVEVPDLDILTEGKDITEQYPWQGMRLV